MDEKAEILIGKTAGFCSGVQRAIRGVQGRLEERKGLYCLGEIIHNPEVIETLKDLGMVMVRNIEDIPDGSGIIIRTHGLPIDTLNRAQEKKLDIFDFTCPRVKKTHHLVSRLTDEGYRIVIIGNPDHPEVRALHSLVRESALIVERAGDAAVLGLEEPTALVVQTTFNPEVFYRIVVEIVARCKRTLVCNTLCEETIRRQREAVELAREVDCMVVVGGRNSSNTRTLFKRIDNLVNAVHIERADELREEWFEGCARIGIISGASTPVEEVRKVHRYLRKKNGGEA
jgi:4-hydroxy-3-methylbut-2-enyl diphosphate reductase